MSHARAPVCGTRERGDTEVVYPKLDVNVLQARFLFLEDHDMRLPLLQPSRLTPEQKSLYDDMRAGIETNFKGFTAIAPGGELIGPWNPWLAFPQFGGPVWELVKALS